jgi:hypothetical protein
MDIRRGKNQCLLLLQVTALALKNDICIHIWMYKWCYGERFYRDLRNKRWIGKTYIFGNIILTHLKCPTRCLSFRRFLPALSSRKTPSKSCRQSEFERTCVTHLSELLKTASRNRLIISCQGQNFWIWVQTFISCKFKSCKILMYGKDSDNLGNFSIIIY